MGEDKVKLKALETVIDKNGYKVFTKDHCYDVMSKDEDIVSLYCDLGAMYNLSYAEVKNKFEINNY